MSNVASTDRHPLTGARRLERLIRSADRSRQALLHGTWILLLLTWCVAWPVMRWLAQRHEAVTHIEPPVLTAQAFEGESGVPPYLRLEAMPRLRQGLEVTQADGTQLFYVPMAVGSQGAEVIRAVMLGFPRHVLDPKSPAAISSPYPLQLDSSGLPEMVRREMSRRGVKFAEKVHLLKAIELVQGRVPNRHAVTDAMLQRVLVSVGSALSAACFIGWMMCAYRVRRLKALSPAGVLL